MKLYTQDGTLLAELPDAVIVLADGQQYRISEIGTAGWQPLRLAVQATQPTLVEVFRIDEVWVQPDKFPA